MYITLQKVADMLDVSLGVARTWCQVNEVRSVYLGKGRGRGARYLQIDIENVLDEQSIKPVKKVDPVSVQPKRIRPLKGLSAREQALLILGQKRLQ